MALDDSRWTLMEYSNTVGLQNKIFQITFKILEDPEAAKILDGMGVHWYSDSSTDPNLLSKVRETFPNKWWLYTEV